MNKTTAGKVFVFLTIALSVGMATWAFTLYSQRIDWTTTKSGGDKTSGELAKRLDRIKALNDVLHGVAPADDKSKNDALAAQARYRAIIKKSEGEATAGGAENHWRTALAALLDAESYRRDNQQWYAKQLQELETGQGPAMTVVITNGEIALDASRRPALEVYKDANGRNLKSLDLVRKDLASTQKLLDEAVVKLGSLFKEEQTLTETLAGADGKGGLRGQLVYEETQREKAQQERQDLEPVLVNTSVEGQLLRDRMERLEKRVNELKTQVSR